MAKYLFISCQRSNLTDNQQKLTILGHVKQCWQNGIWFSGKSNTPNTGMTQQPDWIEPLQMSPKSPKMYIWIFASHIKPRICPWFGAPLYKCLKLSWRCTSKTCKTACTAHFARTARTVWNLMKVLKLSTSGRTNFLRANITFSTFGDRIALTNYTRTPKLWMTYGPMRTVVRLVQTKTFIYTDPPQR